MVFTAFLPALTVLLLIASKAYSSTNSCEKPSYDAVVYSSYPYFYNPVARACYLHSGRQSSDRYSYPVATTTGFDSLWACEQRCKRNVDGSCTWRECQLSEHRKEVERLRKAMRDAENSYGEAKNTLRKLTTDRDHYQKEIQRRRVAVSKADVEKAKARAKLTSENARMRSPSFRPLRYPSGKTLAEENYDCAVAARDRDWRIYLDVKEELDSNIKTIPEATRNVTKAHLDYLSAKREYDKAQTASKAAGNTYWHG